MKLKEIPIHERPIERLIKNGASSLSDEELIAIILRTGTKKESVKEVARNLILKTGKLSNLDNMNIHELKKIDGIGTSKAAMIIAFMEIATRINKEPYEENIKVTSPEIIFNKYKNIMKNKKQEEFYVIFLDNSKKIIKETMLFKGTINQSVVHPREIFKEAYKLSASSIICIHNHPSGNIEPSKSDIEVTKKINEIGNIFDIKLIDHIIIGKEKYYSFLEKTDIL